MMRTFACIALCIVSVVRATFTWASERQPSQDPHINYLLYCAGCHGQTHEGVKGRIPNLTQSLPIFLQTAEGRRFVLSVPGVTNSSLDNEHLLAVLNDLVHSVNMQAHTDFPPFTLNDLISGRNNPVHNVRVTRETLLHSIPQGSSVAAY